MIERNKFQMNLKDVRWLPKLYPLGYSELKSSFYSNGNELKRRNRVLSVVGDGKNRTLLLFCKVDLATNNPQVFSHSAIGQSSYKTTKRKKSAFSPLVHTPGV